MFRCLCVWCPCFTHNLFVCACVWLWLCFIDNLFDVWLCLTVLVCHSQCGWLWLCSTVTTFDCDLFRSQWVWIWLCLTVNVFDCDCVSLTMCLTVTVFNCDCVWSWPCFSHNVFDSDCHWMWLCFSHNVSVLPCDVSDYRESGELDNNTKTDRGYWSRDQAGTKLDIWYSFVASCDALYLIQAVPMHCARRNHWAWRRQ